MGTGKQNVSEMTASVIALLCLLTLCKADTQPSVPLSEPLFGIPNKRTGLSCDECKPYCASKNFYSKIFNAQELQALKDWTLTQPYPELTINPYDYPLQERAPAVCAVVVDNLAEKRYHLESFPDEKSAKDAGAILTHHDACGLCSTLQDLAVYAGNLDVGASVKRCTIENIGLPVEHLVKCIEHLGFSRPCAQIWAYDARKTEQHFLLNCMFDFRYNEKDGRLTPCLQDDEDVSGPIFKSVAGRTRRNTGIANSICRPCSEVLPVAHDYPF
jgi:hypothetical protein